MALVAYPLLWTFMAARASSLLFARTRSLTSSRVSRTTCGPAAGGAAGAAADAPPASTGARLSPAGSATTGALTARGAGSAAAGTVIGAGVGRTCRRNWLGEAGELAAPTLGWAGGIGSCARTQAGPTSRHSPTTVGVIHPRIRRLLLVGISGFPRRRRDARQLVKGADQDIGGITAHATGGGTNRAGWATPPDGNSGALGRVRPPSECSERNTLSII